jgi:hypothetical protein
MTFTFRIHSLDALTPYIIWTTPLMSLDSKWKSINNLKRFPSYPKLLFRLLFAYTKSTRFLPSLFPPPAQSAVLASGTHRRNEIPSLAPSEEVRLTVHMRQTFHEYFIYTKSKGVNTSTAPGFMGAETVSRDELGHKAFPSPQKEEKRKINRIRKAESYIPCLLLCKTAGLLSVPHTKELDFGDSIQVPMWLHILTVRNEVVE